MTSAGEILFASQDFSSTYYHKYFLDLYHSLSNEDTFALVERKMADKDKPLIVPAGTFITSSMRITWTLNTNLVAKGPASPRIQDTRYCSTIGIVSEVLYIDPYAPGYTERRLLRYHVK